MNRRTFATASTAPAAIGAAGLTATTSAQGAPPFKLNYAPGFRHIVNSAGKDPLEQIKFMHDNGFRGIEDNGMVNKAPALQQAIGNLINNIDRAWDEIAYIQEGDVPGRKEPTTGEINYRNLFKHLYKKGYKGVVGMEHGTSRKGIEDELRLIQACREVDNFET